MRNKWTGYIIIFLLIINLSALATLAYNRWIKTAFSGELESPESSYPTLHETLKLENFQSQHMGKCRMAFCREADLIKQKIHEKRLQLIEKIKKSEPNLVDIDTLIDEIIQLESEIQKKAVRRVLEDKAILTPHQQQRFLDMFEHHVISGGREYCLAEENQ